MDIKQAIRTSLCQADMVVHAYLKDLEPEELFVRPVAGANHIAWQLGHLISAERVLIDRVAPGELEALPAGFEQAHKKETAGIDDPSRFPAKDDYLRLATQVRAETLRVAESMADRDFDRPVERMPPVVQTVGDMFFFVSMHWLMHAGQWSVIRRKLGRPPLF